METPTHVRASVSADAIRRVWSSTCGCSSLVAEENTGPRYEPKERCDFAAGGGGGHAMPAVVPPLLVLYFPSPSDTFRLLVSAPPHLGAGPVSQVSVFP